MPKVTSTGKTTKSVELTDDERELIWLALTCRANMIETGNPILSAQDVSEGHKGTIKALGVDQMKLLVLIHELKTRIRS